MRSVALSLLAFAATGALAQSDTPKPQFTVCVHPFAHTIHAKSFFSPQKSRRLSLNSSPMTGPNVGHLQRLPRRPPLAARLSVTLVNGRSRTHLSLSLKVTRDSLLKAKPPTMLSLLPSPNPSTSRTGLWLSNTRSSTRKAGTAVVVMSNFLKMVSKPVERSSQTLRLGLSCSVLT